MKLRWTTPALRDLDALGSYIERSNPTAAKRVLGAIFEQTDMLIDHPYMGRPGRVDGTRELVINTTPFLVPYRIRDDQIEVLAVFHGARRWPEFFD